MERSGSYLPPGHNGSRRSHNPLFLSEQSKQQQQSCELNLLTVTHLVTLRIMVVLGEDEDKVDDDSPRHDQLEREDRVDFPDEASPDGLVAEVEASGGLLILRNGHPGLIGFILHHGVCQFVITTSQL